MPNNGLTSDPIRQFIEVNDSGDDKYTNRILVGTPVTGLVRVEWVAARYGQTIPTNWSYITVQQFLNAYYPLRYQVADAQNLIVKSAVEMNFEWLLLYEHDVIPPTDTFIRLNDYMLSRAVPVVSGLYYTRSHPAEPLIYRGRGNSYYADWEKGDKVWADGVPTGLLLVHMSIIQAMWDDSEEYTLYGQKVRRVFETPRKHYASPDEQAVMNFGGTSDLEWCTRVMKEGYFAKAGWDKYQEMKYPFLVDTSIFCKHINPDGRQFP